MSENSITLRLSASFSFVFIFSRLRWYKLFRSIHYPIHNPATGGPSKLGWKTIGARDDLLTSNHICQQKRSQRSRNEASENGANHVHATEFNM
ncbi:hypothetical protein U6M38_12500, partial [Cutibacterium acnes]